MNNIKFLSGKNIVVFILVIALIALCFYSLDIIMMLFGSFVITFAILPFINKLEKFIPRVWAVALVLLGLILASFIILIPLISLSINEASNLVNAFPKAIDGVDKLLNFKIFNKSLSSFITFEALKDPLTQGAQSLIENSIVAGKFLANILTTFFAVAITVFYFAYDEKRLKDKFIEFFPKEQKEKVRTIIETISQKVGNYVFAQGIAMVFVGALTTLGLIFLHNHHAFLLGFLICVFDIIPVVGPAIAITIGLITSASGGFVYVLLTFLVYIVAQWAQNQLLRPIIFGKLLNMHPLMIIISLLIAARFLGFWGVVLSPAIASVICVLVDELYLNRINDRK